MAQRSRSYWQVEGFDSTRRIFQRRLDASHLGENQVGPMLKALAAKAGLDFDEIVSASVSRRAPFRTELLEVTREFPNLWFSCGANPFFTAVFVRQDSSLPPPKELRHCGSSCHDESRWHRVPR